MSIDLTPTLILTAEADFLDLALAELHKAAPDAQTTPLADGVLLVTSSRSFFDLAEEWRLAPPIFVRHICPVQEIVPLRNQLNTDIAILCQHITETILPLVDPDLPFSVQTRVLADLPYKPFDLNTPLAEILSSGGAPLDVRNPQQILSVVCAAINDTQHATRNTPVAYLGLSLALNNLSTWAGGVRRFAREEEQVSRSEFKLLEALEIFKIKLTARGVALDLGASPGGWTLIVNDMRMDARDSARMMVAYARQLYRHGLVIMTLKLPEQNRRPIIDHAFKLLQEAYAIAGARQLFHNRSEITVYLRLKR